MKATTLLAFMTWLGITVSHSRQRVSDDNAFVASLFGNSCSLDTTGCPSFTAKIAAKRQEVMNPPRRSLLPGMFQVRRP
jgi:hypothetical protein